MRSDLEDFKREVIDARTKKSVTILDERLRSYQEVEIANFLYLNNIDYEYEPIYPYNITYARKPYTPDFIISQGEKTAYIEHFGISESGKNDRFSPEETERYKKAMKDKELLHKQHGTILIYTFSSYNDRKSLLTHLKAELEAKGFELHPRSNQEVMEKLVAGEENRYIRKLLNLISRFISNFKVNGYSFDEFDRMYRSTVNVRSRLFLDICSDCYLEYERWLKENKAVDFEDMINKSAKILQETKEMKNKLDFKYIIVDEYQDISRQRFDLTKALSEVTDARIIAVGDDWQSIYAFSGSDITLFTGFAEKMGYAKMLKIVRTYRNSQDVIDIAGNFIQKNTEQISKRLISPKRIEDPVIIYTYDSTSKKKNADRRSGENYAIAHAVQTALEQILVYKKNEGKKPGSILLLGRFGFDGDRLERSGLFEFISRGSRIKSVKYPELDITFMTAHSSKGLGYDDVIIVNGRNETYGFPSKIEDDPVLGFVIRGDRSIDYAEERRLFYVAMTRTKNRVFFIAPEQNPSEFLLELKRDYKNVLLRGSWNENPAEKTFRKSCPLCGYPLQLRYKRAYGLKLYICSNEPEVCGFMTNDIRGGKLSIQKCGKCRDGYLIVKQARNEGFFLGCTNYKANRTGRNNTVSRKDFYQAMGYEPEPVEHTEEKAAEDHEKDRLVPSRMSVSGVSSGLKGTQDRPLHSKAVTPGVSAGANEPQDRTIRQTAGDEVPDDYVEIKRADMKPVMYNDLDLNEVVFTVLKALQNVSLVRFYGKTMLADILRGVENERILTNDLDQVPEFGALKSLPHETVCAVIEWMIGQHLILKTKQRYPMLHPTHEGLHYSEKITGKKLNGLKRYLEEEEG
ncbi:MAG: UvrD-helicase domain-containing protein [Lachnospiraceae bacterium]|nr:UvrD-helicase domain-containing protein [Lachnospiraceae bacterium]